MAFDPSDLSADQKAVAQRIVDIGVQLGASQRDIAIALATAKRESDLTNDKTPDEYGSVGIFQGRADDARGSRGQNWGYGTIGQITANGGDQSIRTFYLGANTKGDGTGYNAGLLANKDRDDQSWAQAAWKTNGYYSAPGGKFSEHSGNSPYYQQDSENGQFAQAVLAGQVDGVNPAGAQSAPQTGGVLYDRGNIGNVNDKRSVQAPVPNRPPSIWDAPSTWQDMVRANNPAPRPTPTTMPTTMPTITSEKTGVSNPRQFDQPTPVHPNSGPSNPFTAIPVGAATVGHAIANAPPVRGAEVVGHALSNAPVIGGALHMFGKAAEAPVTLPLHAAEAVGHGIGNVVGSAAHAVSGLFSHGSSAPAVAHGGGGGTTHTTDSDVGDFGGVTSERQAERAAQSFLPEVSHGDFHAGETPQLNGLVPTDRSPGLEAAGVPSNNLRDAIVMQAQKWTGIDYAWGGKNKDTSGGLDCSGLVMSIMRSIGVDMGDPDEMNAAALGEAGGKINTSDLQPGDMVAWDEGNSFNKNGAGADHIAFYLGNGYIVEAPRTGVKSRIRKLGEDFDKKNRIWGVDMSAKLGKGTVPPDHIPNHEIRPQEMIPEKVMKDIGHLATGALHAAEKIPGIGGGIKTAADAANHAMHAVGDPVAAFTHESEQALGGAIRGVVGTGAGAAEKAASLIGHAGADVGHGVAGAAGAFLDHEKDAFGGLVSHPLDAAKGAWADTGGALLHGANTVVHHPLQALRGVGTELFENPESMQIGRRVVGSVAPGFANVAAKGIEHLGGEVLDTPPGQWAENHVLNPVGHAIGNTVDAIVNTPAHLAAKAVEQVPGGSKVVHAAEAVGNALQFYKHGDGGGAATTAPTAPTAPGGVPEATQQRLAAAEADRGLQNRANDIYAQQHPGVVYHPASVAGSGTPAGGYQGNTNIRQVEMAGYQPGAQPLPSQLAGYVSTPAGNYQGNTTGFSDARDASQSPQQGHVAYTPAQLAVMQQQQAANLASINAMMAHTHAMNSAITAQNAASAAAFYAQPMRVNTNVPAPYAVNNVGTAARGPVALSTPTSVYQANTAAYSAPTNSFTTGYNAPAAGGYGLSTPSTQAMSTGLDRYADSRDSYYSPTGGGGTTPAAVGTQMYGWSDARDAYVANQQKAQQQAANDADRGLANAAAGGAHGF